MLRKISFLTVEDEDGGFLSFLFGFSLVYLFIILWDFLRWSPVASRSRSHCHKSLFYSFVDHWPKMDLMLGSLLIAVEARLFVLSIGQKYPIKSQMELRGFFLLLSTNWLWNFPLWDAKQRIGNMRELILKCQG